MDSLLFIGIWVVVGVGAYLQAQEWAKEASND
jgi:hypothetical protein